MEQKLSVSTNEKQSPKRRWLKSLVKDVKRDKFLYLMLVPFVVWFIVFKYKPMWGLQIAFKDFSLFKGITGSSWVGLEHFNEFIFSEYLVGF